MTLFVYLVLLSGGLTLSLSTTRRAVDWGERWGILDRPGTRKIHASAKPRTGGIGIFAGFYGALIGAVLFGLYWPLDLLPEAAGEFLRGHRAGLRREWISLVGLLLGGSVIFAGGLIDDRRNLRPRSKLAWQAAASAILLLCGYRLDFYKLLFGYTWIATALSVIFSLLWMLFLMNAFNLLDNMDGLSAGVAAVTTSFFALYAHWQGEVFLAGAMAILVGSLLGFLRYNRYPSKVFMGDGGALLIGFLVAAFSCRCTYYKTSTGSLLRSLFQPDGSQAEQGILSIVTPLVIMAVPIFDTTSVILIRLKNGKPIMEGDTNHFSHRLVALGLSQKSAVDAIYLVTAFTGLGALILNTADVKQAVLVLLQVLTVFGMIGVLERRTAAGG